MTTKLTTTELAMLNLAKLTPKFWAKVEATGEDTCWVWHGALKNKYGHGVIGAGGGRADGRLIAAHRLSYLINKGCIADGLHVLHKCDNPNCCNPKHLYLGTHQNNMQDARERGQLGKGRNSGEANGSNCRLTEAQALAIKHDKRRAKLVAVDFGISAKHVYAIWGGHKWAHLS